MTWFKRIRTVLVGWRLIFGVVTMGLLGCANATPQVKVQPKTETVSDSKSAAVNAGVAEPEPAPVDVTVMEAKGAVAMEIVPQYSDLLAGIEGELSVLIKLDGKDVPQVARQPMDLAIVIDRSGSMTGDKIASVKVAALELLKRLVPDDRVTLVSYASDVQVHAVQQSMDKAGIERLRNDILRLSAGGSTALGPATMKASELLKQNRDDEGRLSHMLLLSDGIANVGISDTETLGNFCAEGFAKGISVSTLGVGLDYNEDLMTKMADEGGGQYHYVREEQMIATVLDDELKGLMATVARDIELEVACEPGIAVKQVFGYAATITDDKTRIRVGSLRSGQNRDVLLLLSYDAMVASQDEMALANVSLHFKDVMNDSAKETVSLVPLVSSTLDKVAVSDSENTEVTVRLAEVRSLEQLKAVAKAVDRGDFVQAEQVIVKTIDNLEQQVKKTPDEKLDSQIIELQQAKVDLELAKNSAEERKHYVKKRKSTAYKKSKVTKGRKSTFEKMKKKKAAKKSVGKSDAKPILPSKTRKPRKSKKSTPIDLQF